MSEQPHKGLLDRDVARKLMAKKYAAQLTLLEDMTNYGSNLIVRALHTNKERTLGDLVVCGVLLKQFCSMLDAAELLLRAGAVYAAHLPARSAFEASIYLEWMLVADREKKALYYFTGHMRKEREWAERVSATSQVGRCFLEDLGDIGRDVMNSRPELVSLGLQRLAELHKAMASPEYAAIEAEFNAAKKRNHDPTWYQVLGKSSLRAIAKELQRLPEYMLMYAKGSEVVHSGSHKDQITFLKDKANLRPIRDAKDCYALLSFLFACALLTFSRVLQAYRGAELAQFRDMYSSEWRQAYLSVPR